MIFFSNQSGKFERGVPISFPKIVENKRTFRYDHIGIHYPHNKVLPTIDDTNSLGVNITFSNGTPLYFKLNNGYLEFENIYEESITLSFDCNMPQETIIDVSYYETTNY